jgi:membrane protein DedA with SNARE-associated domain
MYEFIVEAIARGGYIGIFLLMALENIVPPIPSEVIMGVGGVLVARGTLEFWPLILIGTLGTTAGNYFWYWLGNSFGYRRLEPLIARHGRWITLDFEDIERAAHFFQKYGQWVVFFFRFSPFLRTIVSLPAGLAHMSLWRFFAYTFAGSAIWNILLVEGGRRLAPLIEQYEAYASWAIVIMVVVLVLSYVYRVITWKPRSER